MQVYICWIQMKIHISDQTSLRICNSVHTLDDDLSVAFCITILILCSYRVSYWVPIKLTHVPIPSVTRREDNSASCSYHPLCFYPTNFHLEPHIHIYHEPKKTRDIEYNTKIRAFKIDQQN
jgi:hypothetical protein